MIELLIFLTFIYTSTLLIGFFLGKIRIPLVFGALLIGVLLSIYNPFGSIAYSEEFTFLTDLGMFFLLLIIGFELNIKKLKEKTKIIINSTFIIIFISSLLGFLFLYFVMDQSIIISLLIAISFSTVGEVVLIPILEEFKMINSKLGQLIIGIGTFDDLIQVIVLLFAVLIIDSKIFNLVEIIYTFLPFLLLALISVVLIYLKRHNHLFEKFKIQSLLLSVIVIFFIFISIGESSKAAPIGALVAGIILRNLVPKNMIKKLEEDLKAMGYCFFAPLFFVGVGLYINIFDIYNFFPLIFGIIIISFIGKLIGTFISTNKILSPKESFILTIGLSVRFSINIIILKMLLSYSLIDSIVYSVVLASNMIITIIVPLIFSNLLLKEGIVKY